MAQDVVDSTIFTDSENSCKTLSIQTLNSEMSITSQKDNRRRVFKALLNKLRCKKYASATISKPDPTYRVAYLGNVVTGWAKGEGCVEKPLATLWRNYTQSSRPDVRMQLTISAGGLKATTKDHGLTEYWAHRLTTCSSPAQFPRLFCWVYRHEGRRLRHELRCHAVLCSTAAVARQIEMELKETLTLALLEFKKDKVSRQNARLSLANSVYDNPTIPRRKLLLSTGSHNYKPPLERSKSAPKLTSIEEIVEEEDSFQSSHKIYKEILKHYDITSSLLGKKKYVISKVQPSGTIVPLSEEVVYHDKDVFNRKIEFDSIMEDLTLDEKSDMILEELVQNSLRNDLLESCERAWFNALSEKPDLIPPDCDESSIASCCNSTTLSGLNKIMHKVQEEDAGKLLPEKKTDLDFVVGNGMLSRVRSFEKISNSDILNYYGLNTIYNNNKPILEQDEVSLIPVGESYSDFSSLKVYKKRSMSEPTCVINNNKNDFEEEENISACSDESGFEDELAGSLGNIVVV